MAKKGNMNIDNEDFEFDDEMFPLDDSVYDDDDDLAGFKFDPNAEGPTGAKGFFVNTMKSIKGIGVDFIDEFLPEAVSISDDIKMAISDSKDQLLEKKDKAVNAIIDFKSKFSSKANKETGGEVKSGFKQIADNLKKGKFYTSNRDVSIDMDSFLGEDEEDDSEESGEQKEVDTSGIMTTKFSYRAPRRRRQSTPIVINNDGNSQVFIEAQEASTAAVSSINTRLAKAQIRNSNQNFSDSITVLKSIDDNLYGLSKFLTHYGKTNIDAQLEYDSKSLAFLTDQRALLKDILKANNAAIGIKERNEGEEEEEDTSVFKFGSFNFDNYTKKIKENAKNMFMGTQLGQIIDLGSGMSNMFGKDSGMNLNPMDIAKNMAKSFVMNKMISADTKNKLDRLNDMYGNVGGAIMSMANRLKSSDNRILSFLGELMGTEEGISKYVNLNKENLQEQTVFDVMTKETINETIPGYLSQILSALTGGKLTYYNHESKQFEERDSIGKKYKQIQEDAINTNFKFTSAMNDIFDKSKENNKENISVDEISKAIELFKKNLIQSKSALDIFRLTHEGGDPEYKEKLFRGFESISKNNSEKLKDLVSEQIASLKPEQIADINTSINKVASDVETSAKDFKIKMAKIGGLTAIAEINDEERWEESDYNKKYSSLYNADLVKSNEFAKRRAIMNKLELERSEFGERVGKINLSTQAADLTSGASNRINDIYNLLLNGIKVYPSEDEKGLKKISSLRNKYDESERNKKQKEKEDYKNELKFKEMSSQARIEAEYTRKLNEQALRFKNSNDDSFIGQLREASGIDRFVNKFINVAETPMNLIYGKDATTNLVNDGAYGNVLLSDAKKLYEERLEKEKKDKETRKNQIKEKQIQRKKAGKQTFFDRVSESIENIKESASGKLTEVKNKVSTHNAKVELKRAKEAEKNKNKPTLFRKFLSALDNEAIEKWNNTLLETSGSAKTKVFVDPVWLSSLSDDSKIKNKFYDIVIKNRAYITTDPQDSDIDAAFYAKKNMEQDELNLFHKRDVFEIVANGKNLDLLDKYTESSKTGRDSLKRSRRDRIIKNSEISDYSERDANLNKQSVVKFDINAKNENYTHSIVDTKAVHEAKSELKNSNDELKKSNKALNDFNKEYNKKSEKYKKLSEEEKKEIQKKRTELLQNVTDATKKVNDAKSKLDKAQDLGFKYKYINKINSTKTAGEMFLKPSTQKEIDDLLMSGDKKAIFDFAKKIQNKSKKEKKLKTQNELIEYLDPVFKNRVTEFLADPMLQGKGIKLKESVRSPLLQFALYSKGRVDPDITNDLMRAAGYEEGINYFPKEIRNKMGTDGITVRSLASNHLTGRSFDIESNGSISWKELNRIAASHGIRWAGEKDKPHFEFDEKFNGPQPYTKATANKIEKTKTSSIPKDGSILKTDYINKIQNEENKNDLKISGKPISYYQNDPADTVVTGRPIIGKSITVGEIENLKTNKDILIGIYSNTQRIADNTEKIGFRFGIPGKVGTGLIGKVGDTIKSLSSKLIDGSKFLFDKGSSLLNKGIDVAKTGFGKMKDFASNGVSKVKDIVFADLDKMTKDQIVIKYNLEQELNMSLDQIKKKYKKEELIEIVKALKKNKSIITKGKNFITKGIAEVKDVGGSLYNKAKDAILGKKEDSIEKAKEFLLNKKLITKRDLKKLSDKEIFELAAKNGFEAAKGRVGGLLSSAYNTITKGIGEAKDLGSNLYNKAKDIVLGKKEDIATKAKEFILEKKLLAKEELDKLSESEIIKLAKENGFKEIKGRVGGLITAASNIGNKIINRATSGEGSLISIGGGVRKSGKILSKMDDIIEAIYLANGKEVPEEYKNREKNSIRKKRKSTISKIKSKLDDVKSRKLIKKYNLEERLNMTEDNILELYSYEDLKKIKTVINKGEKLDKPFKNKKNIDKNTNEIEGSYKDQKSDKERKEEKENIESMSRNIAGIATVLGTPQAIAAVGKENVQPENTIGSLLKANYENAELQNDLLEDIKQTSAETAKKVGKGGGIGGWGKVGSAGAKFAKGIKTAGAVATIGAAAAGAGMLIKQVSNRKKAMKQDAEHSTLMEKIGSKFGAGGAGNYDAEGNEIDDQGKAGRSFGINQLVHMGTFAKGVSKIGSLFAKFSGLVSKLFTNPKLVAKIGGKEAAAKVSKVFLKEMAKATAKPGILAKISSKITSFCAKVSQPIGMGVMIAQLIYDIGTGMLEANRYFKMGKGMKPTWPMRITAGLAKAISGNLTFGLIPPANIANLVFGIIGKDTTKVQMEEAKQFDMKRAALMEVEYDRLVEFESMTWSEIVFGGDKKRATILGFLKFNKNEKRKNTDGINKFKNWFEKVYQPLDQMYKDMVKKYGGKVDKKINPDDVAALDNRDKFRKEYLEAAKNYINSNKLQGLGPLGKDKNLEEKEEEKDKEKQEQSVEEKEEKQMEQTSEDSSAQLSSEGFDVKGVASSSPALTASLPKNESESSSSAVSTPKDKIQVNEPKVLQTTGTITNKPEIAKDAYGNPKQNKNTQQTATIVGGKVVSGDISQEDYEAKQRLMDLNLHGKIYKNNVPVKYKFDNANKIYIPDSQMLELVGASDKDIEKYMNENAYYDSDGYQVDKKTLQRRSSEEAENAQADGINFKKLMNKNYISQWKQFAKDNIKKTNLYNSAIAARAGIAGKFKKTKVGALMSKGFAKIKNIASNLIGGAKEKISNATNKIGSALFKVIKSPADAIASFVSNRKESEAEVSSMFNNKDSESSVLNLADKIKDSRAIGQQRSAANLSPEFAQRVEAFLKDPRVMNKGVSIREGYRSPLTQLAYYSKGRASNSITDKLMKKAGFKDGINFWSKSFQKPGDYITWTLASNHFNGTAVDLEPGSVGYDKLGQIAAEYGIDWGGNWSTPDKPHFEMGSPNFKMPNTHVASTTSEAESQQADTINYDRMLNYSNKAKDTISNSRVIGKVSKVTKSGLLGHLNKSTPNTSVSRLNYNAKNNVSKANANSSANKQDKSVVVSNLIEGKFDELLKISTEGVDIMRDLLDETKRHNKKEEEMMMNLLKGIAGLGAIMAASQNGGYSSAGNSNSITKGIFDNLAKGL